MALDGVGDQLGPPVAGAATTPIERVRAQRGVADRDHAERNGLAVDDEVAPAVEESGHHVDVVIEWLGAPVEERFRNDEFAGRVVELDRVGESLAQLLVGGRRRKREREGPVVADEDPVLDVAEVAADQAAAGRIVLALAEAEEAREVDDAGVFHLLVGKLDAEFLEPVGKRRPPAPGHHDEFAVDGGPVVEANARDDRWGLVARHETDDGSARPRR